MNQKDLYLINELYSINFNVDDEAAIKYHEILDKLSDSSDLNLIEKICKKLQEELYEDTLYEDSIECVISIALNSMDMTSGMFELIRISHIISDCWACYLHQTIIISYFDFDNTYANMISNGYIKSWIHLKGDITEAKNYILKAKNAYIDALVNSEQESLKLVQKICKDEILRCENLKNTKSYDNVKNNINKYKSVMDIIKKEIII